MKVLCPWKEGVSMKVFRDVFAAVLLGIMGGFIFCVVSYYNVHKEGGIRQTAYAVVNSFDKVARDYHNDIKTLETFDSIEPENDLSVEEQAYAGILRFHIRANSDSDEDQELKMAVKEDVVGFLKPYLEDCESVQESKEIVRQNLQNIYAVAKDAIVEQGYDYPVSVYLTKEQFPAKIYGDLTFPAGEYQALRIDIGDAKGQNWWCVMFPPLCFIDSSTAIVTEEGKDELKRALTEEEYEALTSGQWDTIGNTKDFSVKGESWIYNWITNQ